MRIVSLLPSATEIVCALGLREQLVGVTHECDYPPSVLDLPKVTRTLIPHDASSLDIDELVRERLQTHKALYALDMEILARLQPDLIVTQALCDVCAVAEAEVKAAAQVLPGRPRVLNLEPMSLSDVFDTLKLVSQATGRKAQADALVAGLQARVQAVIARTQQQVRVRPRVVHLEWIDPLFNAGHWTPELIDYAGGEDCLGNKGQPSRSLPWSAIVEAQPDVLTVALCGFGIERTLEDMRILETRPGWGDLPAVRHERVYVIDGHHYFNRPGPRLVDSLEILAHALHPGIHPPAPAAVPVLNYKHVVKGIASTVS
jgi:iron complex transport system substrate-binding protein